MLFSKGVHIGTEVSPKDGLLWAAGIEDVPLRHHGSGRLPLFEIHPFVPSKAREGTKRTPSQGSGQVPLLKLLPNISSNANEGTKETPFQGSGQLPRFKAPHPIPFGIPPSRDAAFQTAYPSTLQGAPLRQICPIHGAPLYPKSPLPVQGGPPPPPSPPLLSQRIDDKNRRLRAGSPPTSVVDLGPCPQTAGLSSVSNVLIPSSSSMISWPHRTQFSSHPTLRTCQRSPTQRTPSSPSLRSGICSAVPQLDIQADRALDISLPLQFKQLN